MKIPTILPVTEVNFGYICTMWSRTRNISLCSFKSALFTQRQCENKEKAVVSMPGQWLVMFDRSLTVDVGWGGVWLTVSFLIHPKGLSLGRDQDSMQGH